MQLALPVVTRRMAGGSHRLPLESFFAPRRRPLDFSGAEYTFIAKRRHTSHWLD